MIMAAFSFYVGIYYFWMYARRRKEAENLAFALTCFSIVLYDIFCACLYNASSPAEGMFWQRLQFAILAIFAISMSWFVYYFIKYSSKLPFIIITVVLSLFFVAGIAVRNGLTLSLERPLARTFSLWGIGISYNEVDPGIIYSIQSICMLLAAAFAFYVLMKDYFSQERSYSRPILIALIFFFAAAINDVLVGSDIYSSIYLVEYAYLGILLSMAHVLQDRFVNLHREVEELTHQLEEKVNDRTMELFFSEITRELYAGMSADSAGQGRKKKDGEAAGRESSISTLSQDISIIMNSDKLLTRSVVKVAEISSSDRVYLYMANDGGGLDLSAQVGDGGPSSWLQAECAGAFRDGALKNYSGRNGGRDNSAATLIMPVRLRDDIIGVCSLQRGTAGREYTGEDIRIITAFITQAGLAIENAYLYQRMIDRNAPGREHSITQNIEEKMKKALAYIGQNYSSDISREGLAASLNLHPDSFGRFFKLYTNKKISEYINELRVLDAAKRLRESGGNIIDIAFTVGFESLPTFNRAFMKVMKVTPTQYREQGNPLPGSEKPQ